jgi:hypothetical protein
MGFNNIDFYLYYSIYMENSIEEKKCCYCTAENKISGKPITLVCGVCNRYYCDNPDCWVDCNDQFFDWKKREDGLYCTFDSGCDNCNY